MHAFAAPAAFAVLASVLAGIGAVPSVEAIWMVASVLLAFCPSGLAAPAGWRRRGAEALLIPAAYVLTMLPDPTMRRMALPPLLQLAAWAAVAAVPPNRFTPALAGCAALAARAAGGLGLAGAATVPAVLAGVASFSVAAGVARLAGPAVGAAVALLAGALPLESTPSVAALIAAGGLLLWRALPPVALAERIGRAWRPALVAAALLAGMLAPWRGLSPRRALPEAGWPAVAAIATTAAVSPWVPSALAGAGWLAATCALGSLQPAPPDRAAVILTASSPTTRLPASTGGRYLIEAALANASGIVQGTPVARVQAGDVAMTLRAGRDASEWAHERADVRGQVRHGLPGEPVWRPGGVGRDALWGVAGQTRLDLPRGTAVEIARDPALPATVTVVVQTAGPSRATPPRDWQLPRWLFAAAVAVALVQLGAGIWRHPAAVVPWSLLVAAAVLARLPVEPLRLLGERHGVDVALAAVVAAWLPAARVWLARKRTFLAAAALLVPLAIATPHLTPPLYGDEPFHLIVLDSLDHDHDLDLSNNYDLADHPYNRIYISSFIHSPVLAFLLLPGFALAGRTGALVLLALAGAGLVALLARRAGQLGVGPRRRAILVTLLLLTMPLATFSTQIWVEVPGALAALASVILLVQPRPRRGAIAALTALATAVKTRLGLVLFPVAVVAWWPSRFGWREVRRALLGLGAAAGVGLAVTWLTFGHPLGNRRFSDLVPATPVLPFRVVGGLTFDPAGGLAFSAPLLLLALGGARTLWRRGSRGERALMVGGLATVLALLSSPEWYGGGAPPGRYLVPLLPCFALAGAMVLAGAPRWRPLATLVIPPSLLVWWVLVTRPHLSVNPGDGGWWLADALARRFAADGRHLFPSFLRPSPATYLVPVALVVLTSGAVLLGRRSAAAVRALARQVVAICLLAAAALVLTLHMRDDRVVELEDPQVTHIGGRIEPPPGTFSRFLHPNGWRVADGEGVAVPLHLPARSALRIEGWLEGAAQQGATLEVGWDSGAVTRYGVGGAGPGVLTVPGPAQAGHHELSLTLRAPRGGDAVLDRVRVER